MIEEQAKDCHVSCRMLSLKKQLSFLKCKTSVSSGKMIQTADTIIQMGNLKRKPQDVICEGIRKAHFDITTEAQRLKDLYLGIGAGE